MKSSAVILLVEDEVLVQILIEDALADAGYDVRVACSGAEAMSFLDHCSETPLALVTDVDLGPPPSGWEIGRHAREVNPEMRILYMTGDSGDEWVAQGVAESRLVLKPLEPTHLVAAVAALLA